MNAFVIVFSYLKIIFMILLLQQIKNFDIFVVISLMSCVISWYIFINIYIFFN